MTFSKLREKLYFTFFLLMLRVICSASEKTHLSNDFFPLNYYLNLSFDTLQLPNYFSQSGYFANHGEVISRMASFDSSIKRDGGYEKFINEEFFSIRVFPNIGLHVIGGGHDFVLMTKWYQQRGYANPELLAFVTTYLGNIGNEAIEVSAKSEINNSFDTLGDLFIFDLVGKFLFLQEGVYEFFTKTAGMKLWTFQPVWNVDQQKIQNAGVSYAFHPRVFQFSKVQPFIITGIKTQAGLSWTEQDWRFSLAAGPVYADPLNLRDQKMSSSVYLERDFELVASFTHNDTENFLWRFNFYPAFENIPLGFLLAHSHQTRLNIGVVYRFGFGLSI